MVLNGLDVFFPMVFDGFCILDQDLSIQPSFHIFTPAEAGT